MLQPRSVSEFLGRGVVFEAHEAVAVVQQVIATTTSGNDELIPPFGPPTLDNVEIREDGAVLCPHCGVTPAVSEIGVLLDGMLPRSSFVRVPGGLRYTIARALNEVDAPPFDSVGALVAVLRRYERGNAREVVRGLTGRLTPAPPPVELPQHEPVVPPSFPTAELFAADFVGGASKPAVEFVPDVFDRPATALPLPPPPPRVSWFAIGAAAASISFSASYVLVSHVRLRHHVTPVATTGAIERPQLPPPLAANRPLSQPGPQARTAIAPATVRAAPRDEGAMYSPAFASNGTALFYHTGRSSDARSALAEKTLGGDLEVMTILDDGAKNYHVQPSPDGSRIAFDSDRDGERGVYIAARDGSNVHRVSGPGYAAIPTWSPDGRQLAFVRGEPERPRVWNLWLTTLATGETRRLTNFRFGQTWNASWFPDGKAVAYTHEDKLAVLNLVDGRTQTFRSPLPGRLVRTPAVSPDGRHIIFQVSRHGAWLVDLSDGTMRCVLTDPTAEEFAWSPDGRRVAFHSRRDGTWGVWIMAPRI
jgi:Tol biopolymer transport system component